MAASSSIAYASGASLAMALAFAPAATALAATPFDLLVGAWSGAGQIRYQDGRSDSMRCTAYYGEGGQRLRIVLRCKNSSNEIEIRGQLRQRGEHLTGTWEERTFNAAGEVTGRLAEGRINLSVTGGGFTASMSVTYGGTKQIITIATQGTAMKSIYVTLAKG